MKVEIELLLRHYGITSANRGTRFLFDDGEELVASFAGTPVPSLSPDDAATVRGWMRGARRLAGDGMNVQTVARRTTGHRSRRSWSISANIRCAGGSTIHW